MQTEEILSWPPQYTLKKNSRARYVKLKTSLRNGLEIVVPLRFNSKNIPEILENNKAWIKKKLTEIQEIAKKSNPDEIPNEITLAALEQTWRIFYIKTASKKIQLIKRPHQEIVLLGDIENKKLCIKILSSWVKDLAEVTLTSWLQKMSEKTQLRVNKICIRGQQSRWGSCSSDKSISLNYKLLFLPKNLVEHILIHELCHTKHLNHSSSFWKLVASYDPFWQEHTKAVKNSNHQVPVWVL